VTATVWDATHTLDGILGQYRAKWVLRDANGDTRTVITRLVDEA
jgi:hypothetical protein